MKPIAEDEIIIRKYLLGELSPEEQGEIQERLFLDHAYFQQLQMVEDDLIDDYVYEELSPSDRERFDNYFLGTSERYESLRIARALRKYSSSNAVHIPSTSTGEVDQTLPAKIVFLPFLRAHNPVLRLSLAAAILLIAVGGFWLVLRVIRQPVAQEPVQVQLPMPQEKEQNVQPDANRQEREQQTKTQEDAERKPERHDGQRDQGPPSIAANTGRQNEQKRTPQRPVRQPPAQVYSFLLLPIGSVREGGEINRIDLPSDAGVANLQLPLVEDTHYISYRATLSTQDDRTIRNWTGLKPTTAESGKIVSIAVSTATLRQQKYQVKLSGVTVDGNVRAISTYSFQVAGK